MLRVPAALLSCLLLLSSAQAGGRGGHNTTFDANLFGGPSNVSCITATIAGKCNTGFNATCNGSGSDAAAFASWVAASVAANPARAVLYIPPGSNCVLDGTGTNGGLNFDRAVHGTAGIQNSVIWGYGATVQNVLGVGGWGFFSNNTSQALINAANAGDLTVTVNDGNVGRLTAGRWGIVTALGIQSFGSPPNLQLFDYKLLTAINVNTVTLDSPLKNSYKTTYPQLDTGSAGSPDLGGPATIYMLEPSWNTNATILGLTLINTSGIVIQGRDILMQDANLANSGGGIAPTVGINEWFIGTETGSVEVDKDIDKLNFVRTSGAQVDVQSGSVNTLNVVSASLRSSLNGTATNTSVINTTIASGVGIGIRAGPTCCGHGNAMVLDGVTFQNALQEFHKVSISDYSFSAGTLTIAKASGSYPASVSQWVPGFKYFVGDSDGSNTCSPANTFTVTDVQDAGANVNIITDLVSVTFGNTCGAGTRPPTTYGSYQVMSLTQKFSGPANLLSNPEMLPP